MKQARFSVLILTLVWPAILAAQDWPQWALDAQHSGQATVVAQSLNRNIVNVVYDNLVAEEMEAGEDLVGEEALLAHFQAPLVDGNDVYMMRKSGTYSTSSYATQDWSETKYVWSGGTLVESWNFATDWKALGNAFDFWEPVFHPALANGFLYVPGAGGTIFKVNTTTGASVARINPFNNINSNTYTASPISVGLNGDLFYNVVRLQGGGDFFAHDVVDSWLVKVTAAGTVTKVSYSVLTAGAPAGNAQCLNAFSPDQLPWPPSPTAVPSSVPCGTQRAAINAAPAIAPDGTIYTISRAHLISRWGYLVAVNPNLTQKWIASLRERFHDGCGVSVAQGGSLPPNGTPGGCRSGANLGVDPATNAAGGGRVLDDASSSPVIAPDGSIFYGAYTRYNYAQGHLMHFAANGGFLGTYNFGWDITPGIYKHGGTYSVVTKDNHYGEAGSYCDDESVCPSDRDASNPAYPEEYRITQLNHNMNVEWSYKNTNTLACTRNPDDTVTCVSDHPHSFEWCVNAFVIDANGVVFANSEDGWLFALNQGGTLKQKIFQQLALGAAYTPTSIGNDGKVYSQNAGHLFVAGN
jgi:hypothetical protein